MGCAFGFTVVTALTVASLVADPTIMYPEEATIRSVYSGFVLASRIHQLMESRGTQKPADPALAISISNVRTGALEEILSTPLADLVTTPSGEMVYNGPGTWSINHRHVSAYVSVGEWRDVKLNYGGVDQQDWHTPLARVFGARTPDFSRYALYRVSVSSAGRQRQYEAMFLFGSTARKEPKIWIIDYILGASTLTTLLNPSLADDIVHLPERAGAGASGQARSILDSVRSAPGCIPDPVTEFCCDAGTGVCGVNAPLPETPGPR